MYIKNYLFSFSELAGVGCGVRRRGPVSQLEPNQALALEWNEMYSIYFN